MSGPASLLFLAIIPGIVIWPLWALSKEYALIHKAIISIAVFPISFFVFLLAIVFAEDAIVRTQKGSHYNRGRVFRYKIVSGVLALVLTIYIHLIDLWNWLMTGLFWVGCFISSVGIGCLLFGLVDTLLGSEGQSYRGEEIRKYKP
jgi:hypothetical protein